jgi:hypothetical protein
MNVADEVMFCPAPSSYFLLSISGASGTVTLVIASVGHQVAEASERNSIQYVDPGHRCGPVDCKSGTWWAIGANFEFKNNMVLYVLARIH